MEALRDHSRAALAAISLQYPPLVKWLRAFPTSSWPLTLGNAVLIWLGFWLWSPLRRPSVARFTGATSEDVRRRRVTKLRSTCKLFPPPYPNGWYFLCRSSDVPRKQVLAVSAFGRELVAFRGESGALGVLHAFCPHLGTHLGHGGWVNGETIVCPYHSWAFDQSGECKQIPYCERELAKYGRRISNTQYPHREVLGLVLVWWHADGEAPSYEPTMLTAIEEQDMRFVGDFHVPDWHMHIAEPSQNGCDWYHFRTVHQWLGSREDSTFKPIWVQHDVRTFMPGSGAKEADGSEIPNEVLFLYEDPVVVKLFGVIPVPGVFFQHWKSEARFQGPQLSVFSVSSRFFGTVRVIFTFTPEKPFLQRCLVRAFCTRRFPQKLAEFFARASIATVEQDRKVWENKLTISPRNLVQGDGPFAGYGTWLKQFYSASSVQWGDDSIEW